MTRSFGSLYIHSYLLPMPSIYSPQPKTAPDPFGITDVHYVNSYPGAGKTHAALDIAEATLRAVDADYVLVYAAPTHLLLQQFKKNLAKRIPKRIGAVHTVSPGSGRPPVEQQFDGLLNSAVLGSFSIRKVANGSVILVTHECLTLVRKNLEGKHRVSLIFDEARQCIQTAMSLRVPTRVVELVMAECIVINEAMQGKSGKATGRWSWRSDKSFDTSIIRSLWPASKTSPRLLDKFLTFLNHLRNGTLHVWVSLSETKLANQEFEINVLLSPSRLFYGYGKVLILSAFFEHSQMYFFLQRQLVDLKTPRGRERLALFEPSDRVFLINVTDQLIDKVRVKRIQRNRLSSALMTYLFENESLSKYHIQRGIVVPQTTNQKKNRWNKEYQRLAEEEGTVPESYKKFWALMSSTDSRIQLRTSAYGRRDLLLSMEPSPRSVVQYMALASLQIQRAWLAKKGRTIEPLLLCVNSREYATSHSGIWEQEALEQLLNGKGNRAIEVPVISQGLNTWRKYTTAAFMATVKLTTDQIEFLSDVIPDYDADVDRTVDQCIQFIFRSSLRIASASSECLVIVSDKQLATKVNETLGLHLRTVRPSEIVANWSPRSIAHFRKKEDSELKTARNRRYKDTQEYKERQRAYQKKLRSSEDQVNYQRLSQALHRRAKKLQSHPGDLAIIAEIVELRRQRALLKRE